MKLFLVFLFLITNCLTWAKPQSRLREINWKLISDKEGIKVYSPTNYLHHSGLVPIRFKTTVNYDVSRVLSVLADNGRKKEWLPNLAEVTPLEYKSDEEFIIYYRYDLPWPFQDRDFIIHNFGMVDMKNRVLQVNLLSTEHDKDPAKKTSDSIVRGKTYDGYSIISFPEDDKTEIEMAFLNDFGGLIPKWVINMIQKNWPYNFMENLKKQIAKEDIVINPKYDIEKYKLQQKQKTNAASTTSADSL